jgi:anti-anti-sigma regulatory factor
VFVEESSVSNAGSKASPAHSVAASSDAQAHMHELTASCTVRDSVALKSALLDLLMDQRPVTIDVRAVERIDTAALQVLCAFVRDRKAAGGQVFWVGCTESFCEALRLLGLQQVLDVPDAQLLGAAA